MKYIIYETLDGKKKAWDLQGDIPQEKMIGFSLIDNEVVDENGYCQSKEYRLGIPVRVEDFGTIPNVEQIVNKGTLLTPVEDQRDANYCYTNGKIYPMHDNTVLVGTFDELYSEMDNLSKNFSNKRMK